MWLKLKSKFGDKSMTFYVFEIWHKFNFSLYPGKGKNINFSKFSSKSDIYWPKNKNYYLDIIINCHLCKVNCLIIFKLKSKVTSIIFKSES